ncbi:MAG TPA: hypothetical protein VHY18_08110 [Solirubrobacteraceae bacterium]|jgi:hypothetical protein|nr:hypothetical protein [Solirubrobacteraceae bacterium]
MERVNITIGPLSFDHADYDAESDVLYLHLGESQAGRGRRRRRATSSDIRREPVASSGSQ